MKKTTLLLALTTLVCKPMKTIPQLQFTRTLGPRGTFLALVIGCFVAGLAATHAAPPSLQPLLQGKWPAWPRGGYASDVKVVGNYAYVTDADYASDDYPSGPRGLEVIDVSNPANCVRVGGYATSGRANGVAVSGNYAYVADYDAGLQVIDVSNPTNCVRVGGYDTSGFAVGVAVSGNYAYVADGTLQVIDVAQPGQLRARGRLCRQRVCLRRGGVGELRLRGGRVLWGFAGD
jgi:hypothetical protein